MPRGPRIDAPDSWHHVMNRGIARRTLFESDRDIRTFLAQVVREVRAGRIEVHSFSVLTTHFHLLVRSPAGELSSAMQSIQSAYATWFNRARERDGPLHRGRFCSKPVRSLAYRLHLVRYIDANAVMAGLAGRPADYPHGSARFYAGESGPPWLCRDWIESHVRDASGKAVYDATEYARVFGIDVPARLAGLVERRLARSRDGDDPLDDLLAAAPARVLEWMRQQAELADGTKIGLPVCGGDAIDDVFATAMRIGGSWRFAGGRISTNAWCVAQVALLRDLAGFTWDEAGARTGTSASGAQRRYERHKRGLREEPAYAKRVADLAAEALQRCHAAVRAANS